MDSSAVNDPFAEFDEQTRSFPKPDPGSRTMGPRAAQRASGQPPLEAAAVESGAGLEQGLNPLVALANRLLLAVPQLRATRRVPDPAALRSSLAQGIREFATSAARQGIAPERVMAARYVLCTMLDEAAADTPWGGSGAWARHSLLAMFHNEVEGGEKVFQLMARLAEKPAENRDLLEFIYCALALGFEGRYRVIDNGRAQLDAVRDRLAQIVKRDRGDYPRGLAQHWQTEATPPHAAHSLLPLGAAAAVSALALIGAYQGFAFALSARSDPVFTQIQALRLTPPVAQVVQPAPRPRLAQFLQPDIKAGLITVRDEIDRSVVSIRGDGAFAPGSASLLKDREPLMARIADALAQVSGAVLVTGHTDSQPLSRSARFPSNWHLSEERARSVRDLLISRQVAADRIRAEGRADADPLVANDTPGNRALNRRVEVTLMVGRAGSRAPEPPAAAKPDLPAIKSQAPAPGRSRQAP